MTRNLDLQGGDGKDAAGRLAEIGQQLEAAKLQLREAEQARDAARKQLEAERKEGNSETATATELLLREPSITVSTPELDARIEAQKRNLDMLLQRYTDAHPDVVSARRLIKELEDLRRQEADELKKAALAAAKGAPALGANGPRAVNLAAQELARVVATSEVQVAALRARVAEYGARYGQARAMSRTSPQIEAEAAQLNRDYAIIKKSYEDLVARKQSAVMSGDLDMASGVADFRLVDPPRVSPRPVSPNRLLLLPLALLASLAAGLFTAFACGQLRPVFHDAHELRVKTGVPLLGVVSQVLAEDELRRERNNRLRFYAGTASLLGAFLVAMVTVSILAARQVG